MVGSASRSYLSCERCNAVPAGWYFCPNKLLANLAVISLVRHRYLPDVSSHYQIILYICYAATSVLTRTLPSQWGLDIREHTR